MPKVVNPPVQKCIAHCKESNLSNYKEDTNGSNKNRWWVLIGGLVMWRVKVFPNA